MLRRGVESKSCPSSSSSQFLCVLFVSFCFFYTENGLRYAAHLSRDDWAACLSPIIKEGKRTVVIVEVLCSLSEDDLYGTAELQVLWQESCCFEKHVSCRMTFHALKTKETYSCLVRHLTLGEHWHEYEDRQ